jgi:deazaflavin-dependent oxidoreductase (nitroreductase family)
MSWQKLYNPIVSWLLRFPLHGLMSGSTMLITFSGRKSGKSYTTPVNYVWDDRTSLVVSPKNRLWWRNLRGGIPVTVRVRAQNLRGVGQAFEGEEALEEGGLLTMLRKAPPTEERAEAVTPLSKASAMLLRRWRSGYDRPRVGSAHGASLPAQPIGTPFVAVCSGPIIESASRGRPLCRSTLGGSCDLLWDKCSRAFCPLIG